MIKGEWVRIIAIRGYLRVARNSTMSSSTSADVCCGGCSSLGAGGGAALL